MVTESLRKHFGNTEIAYYLVGTSIGLKLNEV